MTKSDVLALRTGGEDVADLDLVARHYNPIDEQLDKLPFLIERGGLETVRNAPAEHFQRGRQPKSLVQPVGLAGEPLLLLSERCVSGHDLGPASLVLRQRDYPAKVSLGQSLELLGQRGSPLPKAIPSRLEFLRVPGADRRESERLSNCIRVPQ
jgi:hypothetical protein